VRLFCTHLKAGPAGGRLRRPFLAPASHRDVILTDVKASQRSMADVDFLVKTGDSDSDTMIECEDLP
jgi:hypothetical protein